VSMFGPSARRPIHETVSRIQLSGLLIVCASLIGFIKISSQSIELSIMIFMNQWYIPVAFGSLMLILILHYYSLDTRFGSYLRMASELVAWVALVASLFSDLISINLTVVAMILLAFGMSFR